MQWTAIIPLPSKKDQEKRKRERRGNEVVEAKGTAEQRPAEGSLGLLTAFGVL